jgi:NAD(P) transhydrogenase subunit beta
METSASYLVHEAWVNLAYLVAAVLFIWGLKGLTHPRTAVRGNLLGASGMLLAAVVTLVHVGLDYRVIIAGLVVGGLIGAVAAIKVQMTGMPQMVALFNGFGGVASVLVAGATLMPAIGTYGSDVRDLQEVISIAAAALIGGVTLTGSLVAFGKLQELSFVPGGSVLFPGQKVLNALIAAVALGSAVWLVADPNQQLAFWLLTGLAFLLGVLLVIPIGGADMPVVIALLNSYSGLAAAATGFVINNNVLIVSGSLVGASGLILTQIMCRAMNRSLAHVLFGVMEPSEGSETADEVYAGKVKSTTAEEVAMLFDGARRIVVVPGYGLAVAQAQHAVRDVANVAEEMGAEVEFAVHPVAGRMPGHMNVLLAEADVSYDKLKEMDEINPTMDQVDVCIVIGANDVVNPVARTDPKSPIAGMPIIDVHKARTVVVVKRSLSPGFAGIPNPLFAMDNTLMLFGDGKKAMLDLVAALKE